MDWIPDLRQLRAFVAVAEEGSFTLGARRVFVTQSAVSHSIRALEDQLSCKLLDRSRRHIRVTPEGELFLDRCRDIFSQLEQASRDLDGLRKWGQSRLRIGAPQSLCQFLVPSVMREFRDCCPRCEPVIETGDTADLLPRLRAAELDLVIGLKRVGMPREGYREMFRDRLAFAVSSMHPLAVDDINGSSTSELERSLIIYEKSEETQQAIESWLQQQTTLSGKPLVMGDMQAVKEMTKLGVGLGMIAPWAATQEIANGSLQLVDVDAPIIEREWGVFYSNATREPTIVEETFIGLCEMAFSSLPSGLPVAAHSSG